MNKKDKEEEIFYRVYIKDSFKKDLISRREMFGIPIAGFRSENEFNLWKEISIHYNTEVFVDVICATLRKYKLPATYHEYFENTLFFNDCKTKSSFRNTLCSLYVKNDALVDRLHIIVNPYAKTKDIIDFINDNRKKIKKIQNDLSEGFPKTLRKIENKDRDEFIYELSMKCKKDLKPKPEEENGYITIARLVYENYGDPRLSSDKVKSIIREQKKYRRK